MNKKQKAVILIAVIIILVMGLYAPFYFSSNSARWTAFGFILDKPPKWGANEHNRMRLDTSHLYTEWAMIILASAGLVIVFQNKRQERE